MIGRTLALATALILAAQVHAQTNQSGADSAPGVTSGPAAGSPATMTSPQAGPLATKHQRQVLRHSNSSARNATHKAGRYHDETGATGSSSPSYSSPPR
jgi:hypothetical protein